MIESKYNKALSIVLIIIIIAIIGLLGFLAYDYIKKYSTTKEASDFVAEYESDSDSEISEADLADEEENTDLEGGNETQIVSSTSGSRTTKKQYKGFTVVGTMRIPSINFQYPILEEMSTKSLETAVVALYPDPDNINLPGNTVVVGHNYRNGLFFSNVKKLTNGSKIYVTDFRGNVVTYSVYNKFEASSTDTSFYNRDTNGLAELTLSTCTDASNDQRIIVFAKQI